MVNPESSRNREVERVEQVEGRKEVGESFLSFF